MRGLNSVLLEGTIIDGDMAGDGFRFTLSVQTEGEERAEIQVRAKPGRLAEVVALQLGRDVRIVGRLEIRRNGEGWGLIAEHVEFKPVQSVQPSNMRANDGAEYMGDHDSGL